MQSQGSIVHEIQGLAGLKNEDEYEQMPMEPTEADYGQPALGADPERTDERVLKKGANYLQAMDITIDGVNLDDNLKDILRYNFMAASLQVLEEDLITCFGYG
jgi:hypothetical protein